MGRIKRILDDPWMLIRGMNAYGAFHFLPDAPALRLAYRAAMGKRLDLQAPKTFNEKLQWLKLHDRNPAYTTMADKYLVRQYIADTIGEKYLIPLLGVWDDPKQIDFDKLPKQFVLKCNHDSGGVFICKNKAELNAAELTGKLKKRLKHNYYSASREWPYKNIEPKVICEQYMENNGEPLCDYKIHCFHGKPRFILVCKDRFSQTGPTYDFYTLDWEHMDVRREQYANTSEPIECPAELPEMLRLSETLSDGIPFLRCDFYVVQHQVYFGELTFFPASGRKRYVPDSWDTVFGNWLSLPGERKE